MQPKKNNRSPSKGRRPLPKKEDAPKNSDIISSSNTATTNVTLPNLPDSVRSSLPGSIAWPTVALTIFSCVGHLFVCYSYVKYKDSISQWQSASAVVLNTYFVYLLFTVMHDSCHGSIKFGKFRWINDAFGLLCACFFAIPYYGFKYCHLKHHKHTNDPERDPDHWISLKYNSYLLLPLQCMTVELKYYSVFLPLLPIRPRLEAILCILQVILPFAFMKYLHSIGLARDALIIWILPGRLAIAILAYVFDYLPHYPHSVPRSESEFRATHVTSLYKQVSWPLTWPLMHQNYHNIHHIFPYIPFYLYSDVWNLLKFDLQDRGTSVKPII